MADGNAEPRDAWDRIERDPMATAAASGAARQAEGKGREGADAAVAGLASEIRGCRLCREAPRGLPLAHEPRPIFRLSASARLLVASQAPGTRAHASGIPFSDASGDRLRAWMGLDAATFYDSSRIAIVPMGFCFPGHDAAKGDLPPRPECRATWHDRIFSTMPQIETVLAIGQYAIRYHAARLGAMDLPRGLTETVADWRRAFERDAPRLLPLPHPSWRNTGWLKRNPWFEVELLPVLRSEVARLTAPSEQRSARGRHPSDDE